MAGTSLNAPHPTIANLYPILIDSDGYILFAYCTGAPDSTTLTYQHGCILARTDSGTGTKALYENIGSTTTPNWNLMGDITAGEITLTNTHILVGNASAVAADVAVTGDITISNTGVTAIGARKVNGIMMTTGTGYFTVVGNTTTTGTEVNVFGTGGAPCNMTIKSVIALSMDSVVASVYLVNGISTVCTIAVTTAGTPVGATSLSNTAITASSAVTVSATNETNTLLLINFEVS